MADTGTGAKPPKPLGQRELVADIDRTRADLARTIDAIAERVSPRRNVDRAIEEVRQNVDRAMGEVRQNVGRIDPVLAGAVAAAVAISITALFLLRRRRR
jgi:Protein of unknown function (DUF3618)